jgi:hypothetical protein
MWLRRSRKGSLMKEIPATVSPYARSLPAVRSVRPAAGTAMEPGLTFPQIGPDGAGHTIAA